MKKKLLSSLLAIVMAVGMIVPMMTVNVNAFYDGWTNRLDGKGYYRAHCTGYSGETKILFEFIKTGTVSSYTANYNNMSTHVVGLQVDGNNDGAGDYAIGYDWDAQRFILSKWAIDTGGVNAHGGWMPSGSTYSSLWVTESDTITLANGYYLFEFIISSGRLILKVNGKEVINQGGLSINTGSLVPYTFFTRGVQMEVLSVSRYSGGNLINYLECPDALGIYTFSGFTANNSGIALNNVWWGNTGSWVYMDATDIAQPATNLYIAQNCWAQRKDLGISYENLHNILAYCNSGNYSEAASLAGNNSYAQPILTLNPNYQNYLTNTNNASTYDGNVNSWVTDGAITASWSHDSTLRSYQTSDAWSYMTTKTKVNNAITAYDALDAIDNYAYNTITSSDSDVTSAYSTFSGLSADQKNLVANYSTLLTNGEKAKNAYTALKNAYDKIAAIGTVDLNSASKISTARDAVTAFETNATYGSGANTITNNNRVKNYTTLTSAESAYSTAVTNEATTIKNALAAIATVTVNSGSAITAAQNALARTGYSNSDVQANVKATYPDPSTYVSNKNSIYTAIRNVYDKIMLIPENAANVTESDRTNIEAARTAYDALESNALGDLRSYLSDYVGRLTAAEDALAALNAGPSVAEIEAAISAFTFDASSDAGIAALEAYMSETNWEGVSAELKAAVTSARADYNAVHPVYDAIANDLPAVGSITLASYDDITDVESSYNALTAERKALVSNYDTLTAARTAYNGRVPTVSMSGTPDSSKIKANVYFTLYSTEDLTKINVTVDGVTDTLANLITAGLVRIDSAADGKTHYIISTTKPAKQMTELFAYSISSSADGAQSAAYHSGTTTVADYCNELLKPAYGTKVNNVAQAMLNYGRAAQVYFKYPQANPTAEQLPANSETPSATVSGTKFDSTKLSALTNNVDSCPVAYSAINVTFKDDTTLYIAFRVKDDSTEESRDAALDWVETNISFGGNTGEGLNAVLEQGQKNLYWFVIVSIKNIPIKDIEEPQAIKVNDADGGSLSVMNYIVVSQKSTNADLKALTQGLLNYYNEVTELVA